MTKRSYLDGYRGTAQRAPGSRQATIPLYPAGTRIGGEEMTTDRRFRYYRTDFGTLPVRVIHMDLVFDVFDEHTVVTSEMQIETGKSRYLTLRSMHGTWKMLPCNARTGNSRLNMIPAGTSCVSTFSHQYLHILRLCSGRRMSAVRPIPSLKAFTTM